MRTTAVLVGSVGIPDPLARRRSEPTPLGPRSPRPLASRGRFVYDDALAALAAGAGFTDGAVADDAGGQLLTARA
jgi:hypothetical protein